MATARTIGWLSRPSYTAATVSRVPGCTPGPSGAGCRHRRNGSCCPELIRAAQEWSVSLPTDNNQLIEEPRTRRKGATETLANKRILLLTTVNRETGVPRTTPVEFLLGEGRRILVIALPVDTRSAPEWYDDLLAEPQVTAESGAFIIEARVVTVDDSERDAALDRAAELDPDLDRELSLAPGPPPVMALELISAQPAGTTWSSGLKLVHDAFRREMAVIRDELSRPGTRLGAQLRINCLTLCGGLGHHHRGEDDQMLPVVDQHHPELADAVRRLRDEHTAMETLLQELQQVIESDDADRATVRAEFDRLTAAVEAHLDYEEEQLLPVLDRLSVEE